MKASKMIKDIQELTDENGDIEVIIQYFTGGEWIQFKPEQIYLDEDKDDNGLPVNRIMIF
jgi:hypothetical protein